MNLEVWADEIVSRWLFPVDRIVREEYGDTMIVCARQQSGFEAFDIRHEVVSARRMCCLILENESLPSNRDVEGARLVFELQSYGLTPDDHGHIQMVPYIAVVDRRFEANSRRRKILVDTPCKRMLKVRLRMEHRSCAG